MSPPLYLASRSPRRRELLAQAGVRFRVKVPREPEASAPSTRRRETARTIVKGIARGKALAALAELRSSGKRAGLILAADTLVFRKHKVLGKPASPAEARLMLKALSGSWHEVWTGICLMEFQGGRETLRNLEVCTKVRFARLADARIAWYLRTGEPFDKAGAYGVQGQGACLVEEIRGSYTNVVGLPLAETLALLARAGSRR